MNVILSGPGEWYLGYLENGFLGLLEAMGIPLWSVIVTIVAIIGILAFTFLVPFPETDRPT